jgi:hypothetical protein
MASSGSVRTAASRRMATESESAAPSSGVMDLQDLRRMEEQEARSRTCCHAVMWFCQMELKRLGGICVSSAWCELTLCLFVSVWVGYVGGFVAE